VASPPRDDCTGDGAGDILGRDDNGSVNVMALNGAQIVSDQFVTPSGADWHIAGVGDFNGDGKSDILWRNDNGHVNVMALNGAQIVSDEFVTPSGPDWHIAVHQYDLALNQYDFV